MGCDDIVAPAVLYLGPQKTASTLVQRILEKDARIALPAAKETFFFDAEFDRGFRWYDRQFRRAPDAHVRVEVAPSYFHSDAARERIAALPRRPTAVVCLRHPVDRLVSVYLHECRRGRWRGGFDDFIASFPDVAQVLGYGSALVQWLDALGDAAVRYLWFDEITSGRPESIESIYEPLGFAPPQGPAASHNDRVYTARQARYPALALAAQKGSRFLNRHGLGVVVRAFAASRIDSLYLRRPSFRLTARQRSRLVALFEADTRAVERLTSRSLQAWRR
jgi:hypothetical protein